MGVGWAPMNGLKKGGTGTWDERILLIRIIIPFITGTWRIIPITCFSG